MDDPVWIDPNTCQTGWLTSATPPGLFVATTPERCLVWIFETEEKTAVSLSEAGGLFQPWPLYDNPGNYPGVYAGPARLALNPLRFERTDRRFEVGDVVLEGAKLSLACASHSPGHAPRKIPLASFGGQEGFPYEVRASHWALFLQDRNGKDRIIFERGTRASRAPPT